MISLYFSLDCYFLFFSKVNVELFVIPQNVGSDHCFLFFYILYRKSRILLIYIWWKPSLKNMWKQNNQNFQKLLKIPVLHGELVRCERKKAVIVSLFCDNWYSVLYCTVLYTTVHYCNCTLLYSTVHYCTLLYTTAKVHYYIVLYTTVLYCAVHYCTLLYCIWPLVVFIVQQHCTLYVNIPNTYVQFTTSVTNLFIYLPYIFTLSIIWMRILLQR